MKNEAIYFIISLYIPRFIKYDPLGAPFSIYMNIYEIMGQCVVSDTHVHVQNHKISISHAFNQSILLIYQFVGVENQFFF